MRGLQVHIMARDETSSVGNTVSIIVNLHSKIFGCYPWKCLMPGSGQELQFVGSCNDIFGQTQLEMKADCGEGMLGSRVGCCSKTACTKRMT